MAGHPQAAKLQADVEPAPHARRVPVLRPPRRGALRRQGHQPAPAGAQLLRPARTAARSARCCARPSPCATSALPDPLSAEVVEARLIARLKPRYNRAGTRVDKLLLRPPRRRLGLAAPGHRQGRVGATGVHLGPLPSRTMATLVVEALPGRPAAATLLGAPRPRPPADARRRRRARRRRWASPPARAPAWPTAGSTTTPSASPRPTIEGRPDVDRRAAHRADDARWPPGSATRRRRWPATGCRRSRAPSRRTRQMDDLLDRGRFEVDAAATSRGSSTGPASSTSASTARPAVPCPPPHPTPPIPGRPLPRGAGRRGPHPRPQAAASPVLTRPAPAERDAGVRSTDGSVGRRRVAPSAAMASSLVSPSDGSAAPTTSTAPGSHSSADRRPAARQPAAPRAGLEAAGQAPDATVGPPAQPPVLVQAVGRGVPQRVDVAGGQRGDEQRRAPDVEHGVGERHRLAQRGRGTAASTSRTPGTHTTTAGSTPERHRHDAPGRRGHDAAVAATRRRCRRGPPARRPPRSIAGRRPSSTPGSADRWAAATTSPPTRIGPAEAETAARSGSASAPTAGPHRRRGGTRRRPGGARRRRGPAPGARHRSPTTPTSACSVSAMPERVEAGPRLAVEAGTRTAGHDAAASWDTATIAASAAGRTRRRRSTASASGEPGRQRSSATPATTSAGGGVEHDDVAVGAALAVEHPPHDLGVVRRDRRRPAGRGSPAPGRARRGRR